MKAPGESSCCVQVKNHWKRNELASNNDVLLSVRQRISLCVACARLSKRDSALVSIIVRHKDAQTLTGRPSPTASAWAFVPVTTRAAFRLTLHKCCSHAVVSAHISRACVCQVARASEAYYQDGTEDGRQQPRRPNETWTLANW